MDHFLSGTRDARTLLRQALNVDCSCGDIICGIAMDSRRVEPDDLFVAIPCQQVQEHLQEARARGAKLLVCEKSSIPEFLLSEWGSSLVFVEESRLAAAKLCATFYGPPPPLRLAVTGTNGKSSVVTWVRQMIALAGHKGASMGTLGVVVAGKDPQQMCSFSVPELTTYDPVSLHKILHKLVQEGVECVALEATSHGLVQKRLDGLSFQAAALTNITQDHLDYHHTLEAYAHAKMRLFTDLVEPRGTAILNSASEFIQEFLAACQERHLHVLTTGFSSEDDLCVLNQQLTEEGTVLGLRILGRHYRDVLLKPRGSFQVENLLTVLGLCMAAYPSVSTDSWVEFIPQLEDIPGRMERVAEKDGASIFVDFCHTPDALRRALTDLKALPHRRLFVVFGCGGERDAAKRPIMGEVASSLADRVFVTDDNPRSEDPARIREEICVGNPKLENIPGREGAIRQAIAELSKDDILLVAGRGHEAFQKIGGRRIAFHDGTLVQQIVGLQEAGSI